MNEDFGADELHRDSKTRKGSVTARPQRITVASNVTERESTTLEGLHSAPIASLTRRFFYPSVVQTFHINRLTE